MPVQPTNQEVMELVQANLKQARELLIVIPLMTVKFHPATRLQELALTETGFAQIKQAVKQIDDVLVGKILSGLKTGRAPRPTDRFA